MRCSASGMFATDKMLAPVLYANLFQYNDWDSSFNCKGHCGGGAMCIVRRPSVTYGHHCCIKCRSDVDSNTLLCHYQYYSMDTLYMYVYILSEIKLYYYYYYCYICPCAFCSVACWPLCPTCSSFTFYHLYNISRYRSRLLFSLKHTCLLRNESYLVPLLSVKLVHWAS